VQTAEGQAIEDLPRESGSSAKPSEKPDAASNTRYIARQLYRLLENPSLTPTNPTTPKQDSENIEASG
jgi:hypothetical protein